MKIFVVDDDIVARMSLIDVIKSAGGNAYRPVEFDSGDAAWDAIQGTGVPPVMACCDIRMPGMSGLDLLEKVRGSPHINDLPFVMITSKSDTETINQSIAMGVTGYIVKPFVEKDASVRMTRALNLARSRMMETPGQAMARLKLIDTKYIAYLSGIRSQIAQLFSEIHMATTLEHYERINRKIETLKNGCATLGLWRATRLLELLKVPDTSQEQVTESLSEISQHIQYQTYSIDK